MGPRLCEIELKIAFCLPSEGRRTQFIDLILTQPWVHLLENPCINKPEVELMSQSLLALF